MVLAIVVPLQRCVSAQQIGYNVEESDATNTPTGYKKIYYAHY